MTNFPAFRDLPGDWSESAACIGHDPALWHPDPPIGGRSHSRAAQVAEVREMTAAALNICGTCPVRAKCLAEALRIERTEPSVHGIYGGVRAEDRAALIRKERADVA